MRARGGGSQIAIDYEEEIYIREFVPSSSS